MDEQADGHRDRTQHGWEAFRRLNGAPAARALEEMSGFAPELVRQALEFGYGDAFQREQFPLRDRQLVTISVLTALGGAEPQLESHIGVALEVGLQPHEVVEAITHTALFCGYPRALNAMGVAKRAFEKRGLTPAQPSN